MIVVVGLNHETAPVAVREALAFPKERLPEALARVREEAGLGEAVILSTCNRVEVYGRATEESASTRWPRSSRRYHGREPAEIAPHLYRLEGEAAVRHAFRVAASLDSMVMGEPQILGQVKDAYEAAEKAGSLGSVLNALRNRSIAAAKRARTETGDRPQRGVGLPRRGRARAEDLRRAARPLRPPGGRGQDERARGAPDGARRGARVGARRPDLREGRAAGRRPRGPGRALRGAARASSRGPTS